ncbi:hypothetical protein [Pseudoalteromonas luteoviolacea]|uniref:Uncharacterized protein n=1 Tax=Pseudoalteromonas luteoviolacea S4054 TaxID=1129367 RepID=A0A0F6AD68_9GAMM|nr:hypothetical protein [Pseudoalteromonas luteoviolacea]AOT09855.1 hypothetical protein S4054249_19380 [Pseudoalteromonas luteoviolacea]AOT14767.1 hypothetical protein S40542_19350 [Pseudoalteromonas luteoviolacea]AOT19682.1 hypothetical protein S4054_19355 [Pseudoalteromonas luteoviolacea]KKE84130.1 hypothetical protein N479_12015 [Pseudoalteromonas luteoviolacea S4054]KZN77524.1 hypothetical protein N481_05555 [Pseudoalteromonas luteoviolacea S4047-1]
MYRAIISVLVVCCFALVKYAQAEMPKSQIWLAQETAAGFSVKPLTGQSAYHNQPLVTQEGVYYTKEVRSEGQSQTDLFLYRFDDKSHTNLTNTPESEYSPTIFPHKKGISTIVVEQSGEQRLWYYPEDKSQPPSRIFEHIKPVGYHAWGRDEDVLLFILGEPHSLQFTNLSGHLPKVVAKDIGRSLAYNSIRDIYSFTYFVDGQQWFATYSSSTGGVSKHFRLPSSVRDYTWINGDKIIYAIDNKIFLRHLDTPKSVILWRNLQDYCGTEITRLSYYKGALAFVCER